MNRHQKIPVSTGLCRTDRRVYIVCAGLILLTLAVYWNVTGFPFVGLDDSRYIVENPNIRDGLTSRSIAWSFKPTYEVGNWHPLTWLSFLLDYQISGLDPSAFHLTNVILHAASVILLFLALSGMTGGVWRSAFVAALFAVHPLHIESVAWITERKDVLSGLFWMLAMLAYAHYAAKPGFRRYLLVAGIFVLGLMSKPMVVTLPIALLILDYWPLRRFGSVGFRRLLVEKIPLFVLSAGSAVITLVAQKGGGAMDTPEVFPLGVRLANACFSYAAYLWKMLWPARLAIIYPHPGMTLPEWLVIACAAGIILATAAVVATRRKRPYLLVGWLWYLVTLVPVVGLVQVGIQGMADRYTYIPLIGVFVMIAWLVPEALAGRKPLVLSVTAILVVIALTTAAYIQARYWRSDIALFSRAVEVTSNNYVAEDSLGVAFDRLDRQNDAARHYTKALRIKPTYANAHYNLATLLTTQGRPDEAVSHLMAAIRYMPRHPMAYTDLGAILADQNKLPEAEKYFIRALRIDPGNDRAHNNLGIVLAQQGRIQEALEHFDEAVRLRPDNTSYWQNYDRAKAMQ